jgi:hypothetical protein
MHTKDTRAKGESEQRLYAMTAWRETPFYTERDQPALAWTEAVTLIRRDHVQDEVCDRIREHFTEKELVELLVDRMVVHNEDVEIRYVIPTTTSSEHTYFCHLRSDYLGREAMAVVQRKRRTHRLYPAQNPHCTSRIR